MKSLAYSAAIATQLHSQASNGVPKVRNWPRTAWQTSDSSVVHTTHTLDQRTSAMRF